MGVHFGAQLRSERRTVTSSYAHLCAFSRSYAKLAAKILQDVRATLCVFMPKLAHSYAQFCLVTRRYVQLRAVTHSYSQMVAQLLAVASTYAQLGAQLGAQIRTDG